MRGVVKVFNICWINPYICLWYALSERNETRLHAANGINSATWKYVPAACAATHFLLYGKLRAALFHEDTLVCPASRLRRATSLRAEFLSA